MSPAFYARVARRFTERFGKEPPARDSDRLKAGNNLRAMIASLNGRPEGVHRRGEPCVVHDADQDAPKKAPKPEAEPRNGGTPTLRSPRRG